MRTPINRSPAGLLDFLGIRSGGRNPQELSEGLLPTMDLSDWYKRNAQVETQITSAVINANTTGSYVAFTVGGAAFEVPQNEVWIMRRGTRVMWTMDASATTMEFDASLVSLNVTSSRVMWWPMSSLQGFTTSASTHGRNGGRSLLEEIWLGPGDRPEMVTHGASAGPATITPQVLFAYVRLRI